MNLNELNVIPLNLLYALLLRLFDKYMKEFNNFYASKNTKFLSNQPKLKILTFSKILPRNKALYNTEVLANTKSL